MNVSELIALLTQAEPDIPVRIAHGRGTFAIDRECTGTAEMDGGNAFYIEVLESNLIEESAPSALEIELTAERAENARLREALEQVVANTWRDGYDAADAAIDRARVALEHREVPVEERTLRGVEGAVYVPSERLRAMLVEATLNHPSECECWMCHEMRER